MVLQNFVTLQTGIPARMHFTQDVIMPREITDPATGQAKTIRVLELSVDTLNGSPVDAVFSVTSEKLAQALLPFTEGKRYLTLDIVLTRSGSGFMTEYELTTLPHAAAAR